MISIEDFQVEVNDFLKANADEKPDEQAFVWGEGSDAVGMLEEHDPESEMRALAAAQAWRAARFDNGLGWITGPEQYGGRGLPAAYQRAYDALEASYAVPNQSAFTVGLGMVAPTILAHGTDVTRDAYLRKLYRGDIIASQLFSEPGAGSDLASLQTKAERDGDEWIITGQKVWTSGAHVSDIGEVIARTDPDLPKHKGLTGFVIDMRAPGVEIRPLRQMTGGANFNEVFLTEVRVPDDHRLGDVNNGWNVALTTLMNERAAGAAGAGDRGRGQMLLRAVETVRHYGLERDPIVRQGLADLIVHDRVGGYTNQRASDRTRAGQLPGPEMSVAKLTGSQQATRVAEFVAGVLGPRITADTGEWGTYAWRQLLLGAPGGRIAAGSDEIMRNIIGERVLGLPKDPGTDVTSPFKDLKVGTQT
ncbi:MAG: acyl-CoA dehydrogenase family protein [Ilumatobacteraceae bacterium]